MNTIIFHPGFKLGNFADNSNWILPIQIVGIIELVLLLTFSTILIVLKSRNKALISVPATMDTKDFFNALRNKYSEYANNELYFGGIRRYNKHFFYKVKTGIIHFPKSWEKKIDSQSQFWLSYNFANMMDIRKNDLNFITKSLWPALLMVLGLTFGSLPVFLVFICPLSASGGFGLQLGGLNAFFAFTMIFTVILSNTLIILSWIWWFRMFGRVERTVKEMVTGILPEAEAAQVMKMFKHVRKAPLLVNNLFRERHGKENWDEFDPEDIIQKVQLAEKDRLNKNI